MRRALRDTGPRTEQAAVRKAAEEVLRALA